MDKETFCAAQKLLALRHRDYVCGEYPLSKKLICDICGATYKRRSRKSGAFWLCRTHDVNAADCTNGNICEVLIYDAFIRLCNKLQCNYKQILAPLQTALQDLKLKRFCGNSSVIEIQKEIPRLKEQTHVLARLKTKGFLDEAKYIEQTNEINSKVNKLQFELKKLIRSDDEDETLDQIEMLIGFFEKRAKPMTEFEKSAFESIVDKIVVKSRNELEFHLIGGLKFKELL